MGSLITSAVIGRTAMAIDVCTAADIVAQEGGSCPNNTGPCTITKAYVVDDNCVIDFGARSVTLSGVLDVNSGSMTLKGGALTITSTGMIDGRGNGVALASDAGGQVCIETSGSVNVDRLNSNRGRIDVSGNTQAGTIEIDAGGGITIAGRLNADQLTSDGAGGSITLQAGGDIVSLANSILSCTGGMLGLGGGDMDFDANGKIDLGDILDVSGCDAGSVALTAGDLINVQQIKANGTGDGGAGGAVTITAATSVQVSGTMLLQGQAANNATGAGDGGNASIEADYGDVVIAATINASGYLPDGSGGEIDLLAQGAIDIQRGTLNARADGLQGTGGVITMQANLSVTDSGRVDTSGGAGGGEVDICAGGAITLNGPMDVSGRGLGSAGGTVTAEAGQGGAGPFTINTTIEVSGGGCAQGDDCGTGGQADLTGCNLIVGSGANIDAGAPTGGEIDLTAREQLVVNGKVNSATTISSGTDGSNVVTYPTRRFPTIGARLMTPAPLLIGQATCTLASQLNCLTPCPTCGDGIVSFPETCDDGNAASCDGCSPFCQIENCNDGQVCTTDSCPDPRLGCRHVPATAACTEPPTATPTITPTGTATPTSTPTRAVIDSPTTTPTSPNSSTQTVPRTPAGTRIPAAETPSETPSATQTRRTATPTVTPTASATETPWLPADGHCDGRLSAADFTAIVSMLGQPPNTSCPLADFNQDGIVDEQDIEAAIVLVFVAFEP